ncbi:MAG: hypothetical protein WC877_08940, partial [Dehalococcoidales bacterium]
QAGSAYPNIETLDYNANFSVGEIVDIAFEYGNRELPKIMGTAKKIAQDPIDVETDYSSGTGGGLQTETVTISATNTLSGYFDARLDTSLGYNTIHNSVDGSDLTYFQYRENYGDITIGQIVAISGPYGDGYRATYYIYRSLLFFDTSNIPENATITSVKMSLYCTDKDTIIIYHHSTSPYHTYEDGTDFNVIIQDGQPNYPHNPVINSDYDCSKYSNNGGQKATSDFTLDAYNDITLNSNGKAWINKGGITKLILRTSNDIAGTAPSYTLDKNDIDNCISGRSDIDFDLGDCNNLPYLTITYEI